MSTAGQFAFTVCYRYDTGNVPEKLGPMRA